MVKAVSYLLLATLIWGTTFPFQKMVLSGVSPFIYNAVRFGIATIVSFFLFGKGNFLKGSLLGLVLSIGYITQIRGLTITEASKSGFIASLYTVFVPFFSYLIDKERITKTQLLAFSLAMVGSYLLSGGIKGFNFGDFLMFICAVSFGLHVVLITKFSRNEEARNLLFYQFLTVTMVNVVFGFKGNWLLPLKTCMVAIYSALFATLFGIYIQLKYQKLIGSNASALIFLAQPITSTFLSYLLLKEIFSPSQVLGALIMLAAFLLSSMSLRKVKKAKN